MNFCSFVGALVPDAGQAALSASTPSCIKAGKIGRGDEDLVRDCRRCGCCSTRPRCAYLMGKGVFPLAGLKYWAEKTRPARRPGAAAVRDVLERLHARPDRQRAWRKRDWPDRRRAPIQRCEEHDSDFELSEEQRAAPGSRGGASPRTRSSPSRRRSIAVCRSASAAFPLDVIRKGFELGFHALLIPEEFGGTRRRRRSTTRCCSRSSPPATSGWPTRSTSSWRSRR
jgi:hypothetical protein